MFSTLSILLTATISGALCDQLEIHLTDHKRNTTDEKFCLSETANFGPNYIFWAMQGVVVNASPLNACSPIRPPPYQRNDSVAWVALVIRDNHPDSGCPFDRKVINAQQAGFGAVLVQNYEDALLTMQSSGLGNRVHIPVAMITNTCGSTMRDRCAYSVAGDRYTLGFEIPFPFDFHVYVISFAIIIGVCLLLSLLVWGIKFYRDWRRSRRNRLPRSSLKKLKVKKFEKGKDPYDCCAICLEDFVPGEKLRILPCNHAYHTKCVDPWLLKSRSSCPVCKRRVFPRSADSEGDEDDNEAAGSGSGHGAASSGAAAVSVAAGPSTLTDAEPGPAASNSVSSESLCQDERTPLLQNSAQRDGLECLTGAEDATADGQPASAATAGATFDNVALADEDKSVSVVRVFVHNCPAEQAAEDAEPAV